jgi:hypothetical protein
LALRTQTGPFYLLAGIADHREAFTEYRGSAAGMRFA